MQGAMQLEMCFVNLEQTLQESTSMHTHFSTRVIHGALLLYFSHTVLLKPVSLAKATD